MEMLTTLNNNDEPVWGNFNCSYCFKEGNKTVNCNDGQCEEGKAINKLFAYEKTGLTPDKIKQLQKDNNRLSSENIMQKETIILMQKENEQLKASKEKLYQLQVNEICNLQAEIIEYKQKLADAMELLEISRYICCQTCIYRANFRDCKECTGCFRNEYHIGRENKWQWEHFNRYEKLKEQAEQVLKGMEDK